MVSGKFRQGADKRRCGQAHLPLEIPKVSEKLSAKVLKLESRSFPFPKRVRTSQQKTCGQKSVRIQHHTRTSGGIGIRVRLRVTWEHRAGSSPVQGTRETSLRFLCWERRLLSYGSQFQAA